MPLLTNQQSRFLGGGRVKYLLRDEYTTTRAAGAVNGTATEPGPGGNRAATDTESKLIVSGNDLVLTGGKSSPAFADPRCSYDSIARAAGRMFLASVHLIRGTLAFGLSYTTTGTPGSAIMYFADGLLTLRASSNPSLPALTKGEMYDFALSLRATGVFVFIRGGVYTDWTLLLAAATDNSATLYPILSNYDGQAAMRWMRIPDALWSPAPVASDSFNRANGVLGSTDGAGHPEANGGSGVAWTTHAGTWAIATNKAAASDVAGAAAIATIDAGAVDVEADAYVTFSGAGGVGVVLRYVDTSNYVACYHDGTNIKLDKVVAGSVTNVATTANTTNTKLLQVRAAGTKFRVYYNGALIGSESTISDAALQSGTRHGLFTTGTGHTIDYMTCWLLTSSGYTPLSQYAGGESLKRLFCLGDSKTDGDIWPTYLGRNLNNTAGASIYYELPTRFGVSGATTASLKTYVDSNLAAVTGTAHIITINLGANDVSSMPAEATWKANMIAIVDALRAKWSSAAIYIARPWRRSYASQCNTLATWIAAVVATYPSGVYLGMDERVWMEGSDDGATMTVDGIHYSDPAGEVACATAWAAVIQL